jgi:hypothetical protein
MHTSTFYTIAEAARMIKLTSSEGLVIEISVAVAALNPVSQLRARFGRRPEQSGAAVNCSQLEFRTLESVVHYLEYYTTTPMQPIPDPILGANPAPLVQVLPQLWYRYFVIGLGLPHMRRVRSATHFLGIDPLLRLTSV